MKIQTRYSLVIFLLFGSSFLLHSCKKEELPVLSTSSITNITSNSATGGGNITSDGNAEVTSRGVCWSLEPNPTTKDSKTVDNAGDGQFVSNISGLNAGTTYHVRAYATNSAGTAYGADMSFTTLGNAPECITQPASNISPTGVTLNGTINANHVAATVTFEYGPTSEYGQTIIAGQSPVSGNSMTNVSVSITGLAEGTTYHYRVVATNQLGTTYGGDLSFTTDETISLSTNSVSAVTYNSAVVGGNITNDGGFTITSRGVCWSRNPNPTIINEHTINGAGEGSFTSAIKCLDEQSTYYVRAYATYSGGTVYGNQESFSTDPCPIGFNSTLTYGTVMDIDGNCYKTIQIGDLVWMAENLKTSRYNDGSPIPNITSDFEWSELCYTVSDENEGTILMGTGAYCWYNNDSINYDNEYGKLYNWLAVKSGKLCPVGWRIPILSELTGIREPVDYNTMTYGVGSTIMETGTDHWDKSLNPFPEGIFVTNSTGFTALPGGFRSTRGEFNNLGLSGQFWASDKWWFPDWSYRLTIPYYSASSPSATSSQAGDGLSIRCVKDN